MAFWMAKMSPLWALRQMVSVVGGVGFEVGDFGVRIGEVRQGVGGGALMVRGAVVEVEWRGGRGGGSGDGGRRKRREEEEETKREGRRGKNDEEEEEEEEEEDDWNAAETMIRTFWEGLGLGTSRAREFLRVPGIREGDAGVRQWCEALRLRN